MKKHIILVLLTTIVSSTKAQSSNDIKESVNSKGIKQVTITVDSKVEVLLVQGGIVSTETQADLDFEKKYNVDLRDYGCVGLDEDYSVAQNEKVFKQLDNKFGKEWRAELRKDTIGFKEFLAKN